MANHSCKKWFFSFLFSKISILLTIWNNYLLVVRFVIQDYGRQTSRNRCFDRT
jgi:hypothetical protein